MERSLSEASADPTCLLPQPGEFPESLETLVLMLATTGSINSAASGRAQVRLFLLPSWRELLPEGAAHTRAGLPTSITGTQDCSPGVGPYR